MTIRQTPTRQRIKFFSFLLLSLSTPLLSCKGQNTSLITVNTSNSPDSTVSAGDTVRELDKSIWIIFQDRHNNYWFGSNGRGVYRYDGKTIVHFTTEDGLSNNQVREIQEDKSGNIYFNTLDGISRFDGQKFTTLTAIITDEWKSEPGDLWFRGNSIENGPFRYDGISLYQLKFPKHYMEDEFYKNFPGASYSPYEIYTIYKDSKGNIWFGTSCFGICRFDGKTLSWMYEKHLTETPNGGSFGIRSILEDKEGKFWFCNTRYRYEIHPEDSVSREYRFIRYDKEKAIDLPETTNADGLIYYQYIIKDPNGSLWMSTYTDGVWRYDGKNMTHYPVKDGDENLKIISLYKDNNGSLWLGTEEKGVYKFNGDTFERFQP